ncbi:unnamed protein product [Peronospora effusa]|nr:unnamed protein product [Peronospora effusa]
MTDAEDVQQELQEYLHKKGINTLFINLVESLLLAKPENPILHIVQYLQSNYPEEVSVRQKSSGQEDNPAASLYSDDQSDESDSEEEEDEDDDAVGEIVPSACMPKLMGMGRRTSVSAETIDPLSACQFERVVHPKSRKERDGISRMVVENILFKSLDEKQHDIVLDAMFPKNFEPGDIIIKQGDDGDNFYILESGVCEVYKDGCLVQTCTEAMSFGELALMYNAPRAATVKAVQHSKAWALDRQTFKFIIMETTLKKREAHKGFIQRVPLLESLSEYERLTVADALKTETFSDGEEQQCVQNSSHQQTPPVEMGQLTSGAYFGEIALLTTRPRQATVTAQGKVKCLTLDRKTFKRVMGPLEDILKRNIDKYNSIIANNI